MQCFERWKNSEPVTFKRNSREGVMCMGPSVSGTFWINDRQSREVGGCICNLSAYNILKANPKAILKKAVS